MTDVNAPFPPMFVPGDLVIVVGREYPPGSGKVKRWMGLFQDVGHPPSTSGLPVGQIGKMLDKYLVGTVNNDDCCLVVANKYCPTDMKWYYLLRGLSFKKCFGWTRSVARLALVEKGSP